MGLQISIVKVLLGGEFSGGEIIVNMYHVLHRNHNKIVTNRMTTKDHKPDAKQKITTIKNCKPFPQKVEDIVVLFHQQH